MEENHIGKMKSLLVAILMIASAMFVIVVMNEPVEASLDSMLFEGDSLILTSHTHGNYVNGTVNITWTSNYGSTNGTYPIEYNLTFVNYTTSVVINGQGNLSAGGGNLTYFLWNTTKATAGYKGISDGVWYIYLTGCIWNTSSGGLTWVNATPKPVKVIVRNCMPGTPGRNIFQGGSYAYDKYEHQILASRSFNYEVGNSYDIDVNSGTEWNSRGDSQFYIYRPVYKGSDSEADAMYELQWKRVDAWGSFTPTDDSLSTTTPEFTDVNFSVAGLWLIDNNNGTWADAHFGTIEQFNGTCAAWFWVNTSTTYNLNDVADTFAYNSSSEALSLLVTDASGTTGSDNYLRPIVDIRREANGTSIHQKNQKTDAAWTYSTYYKNNSYNGKDFPGRYGFWSAGNYSVMAYYDSEKASDVVSGLGNYNGVQYYTENNRASNADGKVHYNTTYGANAAENESDLWLATATRYNWSLCGPWDPPEYNVTEQKIQVTTNTPYYQILENETVYYGFDGTINISLQERSNGGRFPDQSKVHVEIQDDDGVNISGEAHKGSHIWIKRTAQAPPQDYAGVVDIFNISKGFILINMSSWGKNMSGQHTQFADNGTWKVKIWVDVNDDRARMNGQNDKTYTEEWNLTTIKFYVKAGPAAQFKWIDDDGDVWDTANTDGKIPYIPDIIHVPLDVEFKVFDSAGNTFGGLAGTGGQDGLCKTARQCAENITISGNSLFTGKLSDFPGYGLSTTACGYSGGIWSVPIIPTMDVGGGTITIRATAYNSTVTKTINVGGSLYSTNGSAVSVSEGEFDIDTYNKTLTVTVKNSGSGTLNPYGQVELYYIDDGTITAANTCKPLTGHRVKKTLADGSDTYSFWFNQTQQTTNQTTAGFGAAKAPRNLTVYYKQSGSNRTGYALIQLNPVSDLKINLSTPLMMAGYEYDDFTFDCTFWNSTETPSTKTADKASFFIKILDSDDDDVTNTLLNGITAASLTGTDAYLFDNGGSGFDGVYATEPGIYTVYGWNNTHNTAGHNASLEVKAVDIACDKVPFIYKSDKNISATFTITWNGNPVNGTLVIDNMSDEGTYNRTWTNCSFDGSSTDLGGNNSIEIDDTKIPNGVVTVHDITASKLHPSVAKQYITLWFKPSESPGAYARASERIEVQVPSVTPDPNYIPLGRTTKVYCTATGRGENLQDVFIRLNGQGFDQNSTTDVDGRVAFSVTPSSTGNISIEVGEEGRTLADTVIYVVAWVLDVSNDAEVNEGSTFTVTVIKEGTTDAVEGALVTINGIGTGTTDANGQVTFTAPEVTSDRTYTIKVTKTGYAPDPDTVTITVINIPKLIIVIPDEVQATATFEVAVADDTGGAIVGAIISFNDKTYTTGVGGTATITAPKTEGSYPIEAAFGNYEEATAIVTVTKAPGIPGFEILSLIAALGVAFILFRRRRR